MVATDGRIKGQELRESTLLEMLEKGDERKNDGHGKLEGIEMVAVIEERSQ